MSYRESALKLLKHEGAIVFSGITMDDVRDITTRISSFNWDDDLISEVGSNTSTALSDLIKTSIKGDFEEALDCIILNDHLGMSRLIGSLLLPIEEIPIHMNSHHEDVKWVVSFRLTTGI
jgi:hypothetical protein